MAEGEKRDSTIKTLKRSLSRKSSVIFSSVSKLIRQPSKENSNAVHERNHSKKKPSLKFNRLDSLAQTSENSSEAETSAHPFNNRAKAYVDSPLKVEALKSSM